MGAMGQLYFQRSKNELIQLGWDCSSPLWCVSSQNLQHRLYFGRSYHTAGHVNDAHVARLAHGIPELGDNVFLCFCDNLLLNCRKSVDLQSSLPSPAASHGVARVYTRALLLCEYCCRCPSTTCTHSSTFASRLSTSTKSPYSTQTFTP